MAINDFPELITKYEQKAIDTVMVLKSASGIFEGGGKAVPLNFDDNGFVKVMKFNTDKMGNYRPVNSATYSAGDYADGGVGGYPVGGVGAAWETFQLQWNRGLQLKLEYTEDKQLGNLILANYNTQFINNSVVPETDTLRFSEIAKRANAILGNLVTETPTSLNDSTGIIHNFNKAFAYLTNMGVGDENQVIIVNPSIMETIRNTAELNKYLTNEFVTKGDINYTITKYNGREIRVCPADRFITNAVANQKGYGPTAASKSINYIIADKTSVIPVTMLKNFRVIPRELVQDFDGTKVNFHLFHGIFVPDNKVPSIYVSVATTLSDMANGKLKLSMIEGLTAGTTKVLASYSIPAGANGTLVRSAAAFTVGTSVTVDGENVKAVTYNDSYTPFGANEYFALVSSGLCIAASDSIAVPTKA